MFFCSYVLTINHLFGQRHREMLIRSMLLKDDSFHLFHDLRMLECYIVVLVNIRFQIVEGRLSLLDD